MAKLATAALVALSVSKLEAELNTGEYTPIELEAALAAEKAGSNRSTAIEAIEDAATVPTEEAEEITAGVFVCKGKAVTTAAGIKGPGEEITKGMIPDDNIQKLVAKKFLEVIA